MELKILVDDEKGDKKKSLALKAEEEKGVDFDENIMLLVQNFKRYIKYRNNNRSKRKI